MKIVRQTFCSSEDIIQWNHLNINRSDTLVMMKNFTISMLMGIAATTGIVAVAVPARAASLSFVGSFAANNPNQLFTTTFTTTSSSLVNFRSTGYAAGGFEPILTVFDNPTGNFIFEQYLTPTGSPDFNVDRTLVTGDYKVVLSTFANFLKQRSNPGLRNIADGFENQGDFDSRNPTFAFSINNVNLANSPAVPEPADLIGTLVGGFGVVMFKRKLSAGKKS
jgi:hypothetical protein